LKDEDNVFKGVSGNKIIERPMKTLPKKLLIAQKMTFSMSDRKVEDSYPMPQVEEREEVIEQYSIKDRAPNYKVGQYVYMKFPKTKYLREKEEEIFKTRQPENNNTKL
jgi:hypothetical protein